MVNNMINNIEVKQLFNYSRFPDSNALLLLYLPFGVLLVLVRVILLLIVLLLSTILPRVKFLQVIYQKLLCITFGISINAENIERREDVDAYVGNQVSVLDSFVIHILTQCITPAPTMDTQLSKLFGQKFLGPLTNLESLKHNIAHFNARCRASLFLQPEASATNGQGLLKFNAWHFSLASKIQPILIETKRPLFNIAISTIDSSYWSNLFYYMFSPLTVYKIRFLPAVEKKGFNDEEFGNKMQADMGRSLNITSTKFTANDMREYRKRYMIEQQRLQTVPVRSAHLNAINAEIQRMGRQVKEVLPMVPLNVIYRDLAKTRNVDVTITNILEGLVPYTPETVPTPSTSASSSSLSSSSQTSTTPVRTPTVAATGKDPFNTAAATFGKSAGERTLSFHERKAQLIANARQRYIEKHGLEHLITAC